MAVAIPAATGALGALGGALPSWPVMAGLWTGAKLAKTYRNALLKPYKYRTPRRARLNRTIMRGSRRSRYRGYKKRTYRKRYRKGRKKPVRKKLATLAKKVNQDTGELTYRSIDTAQHSILTNVQGIAEYSMNTVDSIENGPCTKLYYYDAATPGTLLNPDYTTGSYARELNIHEAGLELKMKNNSTGSIFVTAYLCQPRGDTSIAPATDWANRCADSPVAIANTDFGTSPMDLRLNLWNFKVLKKVKLVPGSSSIVKHYTGSFNYKPALSDVHAFVYQRVNKAFTIMLVIRGDIAHDDAINNRVGRSNPTLDIERKRYFRLSYAAGVNLKYVVQDNTFDSLSNGATSAFKTNPQIELVSV